MATRAQTEEAAQLAARGLELYGQGRSEEAAATWRRALALDPEQAEARDYMRTAGLEGDPVEAATAPPVAAAPPADAKVLLGEAAELVARGDGREALGLLLAIAGDDDGLEVQATVELLRAHLFERYLQRTGEGDAVPEVRVEAGELLRFNLSRDAGFVLSLVDGTTCVRDLLAVSGMDAFETLQALVRLEEGGLLGWREAAA